MTNFNFKIVINETFLYIIYTKNGTLLPWNVIFYKIKKIGVDSCTNIIPYKFNIFFAVVEHNE